MSRGTSGVWRLAPFVGLALVALLTSACAGGSGAPAGGAAPPAYAGGSDSMLTPLPAFITPAGGRIAFVSLRNGMAEIHSVYPDGSGLLNLSKRSAPNNSYPDWSPDGSLIAFASGRDGDGEIYVMNPDGSDQTRLTDDGGSDGFPVW
ncbi:MAG: hypothetical protein V3S20_04045, partial [Dehalococcoidia bacterium]